MISPAIPRLLLACALALCGLTPRLMGEELARVESGRFEDVLLWGRKFGFFPVYSKASQQILLKSRWATIIFDMTSRKAWINGIQVWLSYPIRPSGGGYLVYETDLRQLFEPVLKPEKMPVGQRVRTIAIDPGHGGKDPGFERGAQAEKKYTLALAAMVKEMLEEAGFKVVLTRGDDQYVEREARPDVAKKARADLFVSLHFNSSVSDKETVKGIETFVLTPTGAPPSNGNENMRRRWPGHHHSRQSSLLAYMVQKSAVKTLAMHDRGVKRAGFEVLRLADMPAILVEGGFMSNTEDARRIFNPARRAELARAIVDGILDYRRAVERTGVGDEG